MHTIPPKYVHQTTYYSVVPAYMALLSYAFHHDLENKWFCMLTDSCVPIISPAKFRQLFFENYRASIFKWKPAYWNINIHRRANLRLLKKEYWLANDPWFTLSRAHVHKCILFLVAKNDIYRQVNSGGLANESIFAIMLQTFNELSNSSSLINAVNTVKAGNLSVTLLTSNLIPNSNGILSLANATSRYKDFFLSGNIDINGQTISANVDGITAGNLFLDTLNVDTVTVNTQLIINSSTQSTSTDTGSFVTEGGIGIKKDLTVGGNINLATSSNASPQGVINYNQTSSSIDFKFNG
jgi:hypothetical protein